MIRLFFLLITIQAVVTANAFRVYDIVIPTAYLDGDEWVTTVVPDRVGDERFPTVYILNGYSGNHTDYITRVKDLGKMADRFKMIFVMPDGRNSWYWDTDSMKMESFVTRDLVADTDRRFPTLADRDNRAIMGLSMGGHGAFRLATLHPDIWGSAGSMSGGMDITKFANRWGMAKLLGCTYEADPTKWKASTVAALVPQMKTAGVNYTFDCGADDFFAAVNADLHQAMLDAGVPHDYASRPGKHSWQYWNNSLPYILHYFDTKFPR